MSGNRGFFRKGEADCCCGRRRKNFLQTLVLRFYLLPAFILFFGIAVTDSCLCQNFSNPLNPSSGQWISAEVSKKAFLGSGSLRIYTEPGASRLRLRVFAGTELFGGRIGQALEELAGLLPVASARVEFLFHSSGVTLEAFTDSSGEVILPLSDQGREEEFLVTLSLDGELTRGFVAAVHELDNRGFPLFPQASAFMGAHLRILASGDRVLLDRALENLSLLEAMLEWIMGCEDMLLEAQRTFSLGLQGLFKALEGLHAFFGKGSLHFSSPWVAGFDGSLKNPAFQQVLPYVAREILRRDFDLFRLLSRDQRLLYSSGAGVSGPLEQAVTISVADLCQDRASALLAGRAGDRAASDFSETLKSNLRAGAMEIISRWLRIAGAGLPLHSDLLARNRPKEQLKGKFSPLWADPWPRPPLWNLDRSSPSGLILLQDTLRWLSESCLEAVRRSASGDGISRVGPFQEPLARLSELAESSRSQAASEEESVFSAQLLQSGDKLDAGSQEAQVRDRIPPYLERVVEYAKFGIYRKLDKELSESLENYRSFIAGLLRDGSENPAQAWRFLAEASQGLNMVGEVVHALARTPREGLTQNVTQSFDMSLRSYLELKAQEGDCVLSLVSLAGKGDGIQGSSAAPEGRNGDGDGKAFRKFEPALIRKLQSLEARAKELSLHLGEAFAKIVIENVTIPGTLVICEVQGSEQPRLQESRGLLELEVRNIGMEPVSAIELAALDNGWVKVSSPVTRTIDKLGANESRRVSFEIEELAYPPFGVTSVSVRVRQGNRVRYGCQVFHQVSDKRAPQIRVLSPAQGGLVEANDFTVRIALEDQESGIDPTAFKAILNGQGFRSLIAADSGLTAEVVFPGELRRRNVMELTCLDRAGNSSSAKVEFRGRVVNWPLVIGGLLVLGLLLWSWATAYINGEWNCLDCGFPNSWWDPSCAHCERERGGWSIQRKALGVMAWILRWIFRIWESFIWTSKEARKKVFVQFHRQRLSRHLSDMGEALWQQKGIWLDQLMDQAMAQKLDDYQAFRDRLEELEAFAASLRARGENGDLMASAQGGLMVLAEELRQTEDEIHDLSRRKRRVQLELGEWIYSLCKGGARVPSHFQEASGEAFEIERAMTESMNAGSSDSSAREQEAGAPSASDGNYGGGDIDSIDMTGSSEKDF